MGVKSMKGTERVNLECAYQVAAKYPELKVGFDLVDNEDTNDDLWDFRDVLITMRQELEKKYGSEVSYVFHAGESNNPDCMNVMDALMLGTKRIGHGFVSFRQHWLVDEIKKRGMVVEVNMLSNHIMKYHNDLRIHPSIMLHNAGCKIALNSDDPGVFRISLVSHDTLAAVYAFPLDLRDLKRIQLNGIDGMLLSKEDKQ